MSAPVIGLVVAVATAAAVAALGALPAAGATLRARHRSSALAGRFPVAGPGAASGGAQRRLLGVWAPPSGRLAPSLADGAARVRAVLGIGGRSSDRALPELLQTVARELRSGASLATAVVVAAEAVAARPGTGDPSAAALARAVRRGTPLAVAVADWTGPDPTGARRLAGTALVLAAETGGTTAVVVDGVADTLRDRVALEREVGALSSQARASAVVLVVAPVVVAVLAASADERIAAFLLGSPLGWACVACGLVLDAVGAAWMHVTIRRAT